MLALILALGAVPAAQGAMPVDPPARCGVFDGVRPAGDAARGQGEAPARARRLDRLPAADHVLAVFRTIDNCPAPVIVRSDIGGARPR